MNEAEFYDGLSLEAEAGTQVLPGAICGIIPAAGAGRRMGCCKQLLPMGGIPAVLRCVASLRKGGIDTVVAVVGGPYESEVAKALAPLGVVLACNPDPGGDMASSLRCAIPMLPEGCRGVAVLPADIPCVLPETIRRLLDEFVAAPDRIVLPSHRLRRGHPVLLPVSIFAELREMVTLREVIAAHGAELLQVTVEDAGVLRDMDVMKDYREMTGGVGS